MQQLSFAYQETFAILFYLLFLEILIKKDHNLEVHFFENSFSVVAIITCSWDQIWKLQKEEIKIADKLLILYLYDLLFVYTFMAHVIKKEVSYKKQNA